MVRALPGRNSGLPSPLLDVASDEREFVVTHNCCFPYILVIKRALHDKLHDPMKATAAKTAALIADPATRTWRPSCTTHISHI
jgi:hypothetical protein